MKNYNQDEFLNATNQLVFIKKQLGIGIIIV